MVSKLGDKVLLGKVDVGAGRLRGFGCTAQMLDWMLRNRGRDLLLGDLSPPVVEPVDLAGADFPLVADCSVELGLGQAWGQTTQHELQTWLGGFGASRSLRRRVSLQDCDGQDAVDARLGGHGRGGVGCGQGGGEAVVLCCLVVERLLVARSRSVTGGCRGPRGAAPWRKAPAVRC